MKSIFPGYYKKNNNEIEQLWDNGLILFDTNVLLNLYRYSDTTRETIIDLISKFSEKIFLPHQAALEYNRNRYEVIAEQEKAYKEFLNKISQIQQDLQSTNKPPFLSSSIDSKLNKVFDNVSNEVEESIKKYNDFLKEDPIYNKLSELFKDKITEEFSLEDLDKIYKEGEHRYNLKIPPGFEDEKTKEGNRKYGDLVLWKQIIRLGKEKQKDIILITDERKIDWWWKIKDGRNMGPRHELVEEIFKESNVNFHMYSSERFLSYGQTYLNEQINKKALEEIQAMKFADMEIINQIKDFEKQIYYSKYESMDINSLYKRIEEIDELISKRNSVDNFLKKYSNKEDVNEFVNNYNNYIFELRKERDVLKDKIDFEHKHSYLNANRHYNYESRLDKEILEKFIDISKRDLDKES